MDIVVASPTELRFQHKTYSCAIGRGGFSDAKREGDGATPLGRFKLRTLRYRADRLDPPNTRLTTHPLSQQDGWCDAPDHVLYNRPVPLPFDASHERLWRDDSLYNLVVDLGFNDDPPVPYLGSAIFLHVAGPEFDATEGCVALAQEDLLDVLAKCDTETWIDIMPQGL